MCVTKSSHISTIAALLFAVANSYTWVGDPTYVFSRYFLDAEEQYEPVCNPDMSDLNKLPVIEELKA